MHDEINRMRRKAEVTVLYHRGTTTVEVRENVEEAISDLIANLAILAHEERLPLADLIQRGLAHYCATYMKPLDPADAEEWLNEALFPFTGEREFAEYVADQAITLSGKAGRVTVPEWGT